MKSKNKIYQVAVFVILIMTGTTVVCSSNRKDSKKTKDGWSESYGRNIKSKFICLGKLILDCEKWSLHLG